MSDVGLFVLCLATGGEWINEWVESYLPEYHNGCGYASFTHDPQSALRFPDAGAALECWRTVPPNRPVRLDGEANRPLTRFTVEVKALPPLDRRRCLARDRFGVRCTLPAHPGEDHAVEGVYTGT